MYRKILPFKTTLKRNTAKIGERLEQKVARISNNKEPITDGSPTNYTERKDGVLPEYNIRNDKWETALDAMDYAANKHKHDRDERLKSNMEKEAKSETKNVVKDQSTDGTSGTSKSE